RNRQSPVNLEPRKLFERDHPASQRDASASQPGARARDGNGNTRGLGLSQCRNDAGFIRRNYDPLRMTAETGSILEVVGRQAAHESVTAPPEPRIPSESLRTAPRRFWLPLEISILQRRWLLLTVDRSRRSH